MMEGYVRPKIFLFKLPFLSYPILLGPYFQTVLHNKWTFLSIHLYSFRPFSPLGSNYMVGMVAQDFLLSPKEYAERKGDPLHPDPGKVAVELGLYQGSLALLQLECIKQPDGEI